jgi:hypothetical protein
MDSVVLEEEYDENYEPTEQGFSFTSSMMNSTDHL